MKLWLWLKGPRRLWVREHEWRCDEQGRPYNASLTRLSNWALR